MGPTEFMASWILETTYDDIPSEAKRAAQQAVFDCMGVMLAGAAQPLANIIIGYAEELGGKPEASVIPTGQRIPACNAALVNGTLAHALDYDDLSGFAHPAPILLPALLALAEKTGASGRDVLEAYIIGHEAGEILRPQGKGDRAGFHVTAAFRVMTVYGHIGAAAACARLLNLDRRQTQIALGIAAGMASGLSHSLGTMTKSLEAGSAARNGVVAAELAARGWTAGEHVLEHPAGFMEAFFGAAEDAQALVKRLGNPFRLQDMLIIKKYPCGFVNHPTIDALLDLMAEHHFDYRDVEEVEIQQNYYSLYIDPINERPSTGLQAKFSMVYNAAATLVLGKVDIDTFSDERVNDPLIRETMDKIRIRVLSRWEESYVQMERRWPGGSPGQGRPVLVRLKNGKVVSKATPPEREKVLGGSENPWGFENIRRKFENNARLVLAERQIQEAARVWSRLEQVTDIREAIPCVLALATGRRRSTI